MNKEESLETLDKAIAAETRITIKYLLIYCRDYIKEH